MFLLLKKLIHRTLLSFFILFGISACYSLRVVHNQHKLYSKREKVAKLEKSHRIEKKLKEKLVLVNEALHFCEDEELFVGKSYQELIFNEKSRAVSFLLQLAYPFELKWVEWSYPVIGRVPYQGFFQESARDAEAKIWEKKNFDISKGTVTAFSTLGWFSDPLYSSMLKQRDFALVETIFHELVHKTYWLRDDVVSNEHLATYLSHRMTKEFLKRKKEQEELKFYEAYLADRRLFYHWLLDLKQSLQVYYVSLKKEDSLEKKIQGKKNIFAEFLQVKKPNFAQFDFIGKGQAWNNADVLASGLYQPDSEFLDKVYHCSKAQNVGDFLRALKIAPGKNFKAKTEYLCRVSE